MPAGVEQGDRGLRLSQSLARNKQSQATPVDFGREENIKDAMLVARVDTRPVVRKQDRPILCGNHDAQPPIVFFGLAAEPVAGVVDQVVEYLRQRPAAHRYGQRPFAFTDVDKNPILLDLP